MPKAGSVPAADHFSRASRSARTVCIARKTEKTLISAAFYAQGGLVNLNRNTAPADYGGQTGAD
jgi:hypothetical protein